MKMCGKMHFSWIHLCWWLLMAMESVLSESCSPFGGNCNAHSGHHAMRAPLEERSPVQRRIDQKIATMLDEPVNYSRKLGAYERIHATLKGNNTATLAKTTTRTYLSTMDDINVDENDDDIADNEEEYVYNIGERLMGVSQPFDVSASPTASAACYQQSRRYVDSLRNFELWALQMHDASGRLGSGIMNGNINQLGDFDQCLRVDHRLNMDNDLHVKGQYCLAYVQPQLGHKSQRLRTFFKLLQSHAPFRSEFNDPGHRVPRYSLINWGICVPSSCSHKDVEYVIEEYLKNMTASTGVAFKVRVESRMCQTKVNNEWDRNTTIAVRFFVAILALTVLSTIYERYARTASKPNEWLTAFSMGKNARWLFSATSSPDDIHAVHGIRCLNAIMLLLAHKSMAMFFNPYNNRTEMAESLGRPWTVIGRAASLYTDPFLLFSGMLTSYSLFGRLLRGQPVGLRNEYISRLIRIVPPLVALIVFCTYVLPMWGSGPQWNLVVGHHSDICKKNWWRNLLFIQNYFGFSEMCLTHTHHLGIDTELFAVAPLMIIGLWKQPKMTTLALVLLCAVGTAARYYTTVTHQLSNYIYFGTNIQRLFRTADYAYSFPPYRSTVYIMGILLGYGLRRFHGIKLSRAQLRIGWTAAIVCVLLSLFGPAPMGDIHYEYNATHAAIYAAFAPIAWCSFFVWIVFVSHNGYHNGLTKMLSWRGFQVSTKLSYAVYLTQFPVFFYNVGRRRHIQHYYNFVSTILDTNEFISIFAASILLTLLFDAPFQNIRKLLLKRPATRAMTTKRTNNCTQPLEPPLPGDHHLHND